MTTAAPPVETAAAVRELRAVTGESVNDLRLDGLLTWVGPGGEAAVIQDASGAVLVQLDSPQAGLVAGRKAVIEGQMMAGEGRVRVLSKPVVENDGVHGVRERSGTLHLTAGRHPLRLEYFQRDHGLSFDVEIEGPDLPRQAVSAKALWHRSGADGEWAGGLEFAMYQGLWQRLPEVRGLAPDATGIAPGFELSVTALKERFALAFSGFVEVAKDGNYSFFIRSDDGSRLFIGEQRPLVTPGDAGAWPQPRPVEPGQAWPEADDYQWAEAEGTVAALGQDGGRWRFELLSEAGKMSVEMPAPSEEPPLPLLGSRVKVRGACFGATGPGGVRAAAGLLVPRLEDIRVQELPWALWSKTPSTKVAALSQALHPAGTLVQLQGKVLPGTGPNDYRLQQDGAEIAVKSDQEPLPAAERSIRLLGTLRWEESKPVIRAGVHLSVPARNASQPGLPPLSTIAQVRAMRPEEFPARVRIRGVVTCDQDSHSVTIQETGSGITCWLQDNQSPPLQMSDEVELTGRLIRGNFAPNLMNASVVRLGKGLLPEPARPAREPLLNGSLNAQWVEVEGLVQKVEKGSLTVAMRGGPVDARVLRGDLPALMDLRGALVRVRGIVAPVFNKSRQIQRTYLRVSSPLYVTVISPAGADPFEVPQKRVPELLEFDPAAASAFHRVKVAGLVIHSSAAGSYVSDEGHGARFVPRDPVELAAGTVVEISTIPQLGGKSPVLTDAIVRATGRADLPAPAEVTVEDLLRGQHDAGRVRLRATLVGVVASQGEQLLEMQRDHWKFSARLPAGNLWPKPAAAGSELEMSGVCAGHGTRFGEPGLDSFELLLNSPADIRVLSQPSWWTAQRIIVLAGILALVLALALVWIVQLRRKVEERTAQLAVEIHQRELAEQRRAIEEERSRIARDLHDDLGARVTKIAMLAEQAGSGPEGMDPGVRHIYDTSHELTRAMDEVVWTVNPRNDVLPKLAHYLLHYAEKYFEGANLRLRLRAPGELPPAPVTASVRHHLFLAVKEALRNVMKHSGATECRVEVALVDDVFQVTVADNGRGFDGASLAEGRNGLTNMRERLGQLGGTCTWQSAAGEGTSVTIGLELAKLAPGATEIPREGA